MLILLEPFSSIDHMESVRVSLHYHMVRSILSGKIWVFWKNDL